MTGPIRQRLFFALWPEEDTRLALASLAKKHLSAHRGRLVDPRNLHLTLAFLGSVDEDFRGCAERAAGTVAGVPFVLELQHIGHWRRPQVLWSAPESTPDALLGLVGALNRALVPCGHEPDIRPYSAHITLARKVRGPVAAVPHPPIRWAVREFCLVASETHPRGARYTTLARWPLG